MRANIENGLIVSIGTDSNLPYQLPNHINYGNFAFFICVNTDDSGNLKSWVDKKDYEDMQRQKELAAIEAERQSQMVVEEEQKEAEIGPETEEVVLSKSRPQITMPRIIVTIFFLLSLAGVWLCQYEPYYVVLTSVLFVAFASLAMIHIWKPLK